MEDKLYLDCGGKSQFPIQSSDIQSKAMKLSGGQEYNMMETGYEITPSEGSSFPTRNLFVSSENKFSSPFESQHHVLDCREYELPLESWLPQYQIFQKELHCVKDTLGNESYIMRPTKHALAIIKGIIKEVANLHSQKRWLSYPVIYGVNTLSNPKDDHCEIEVIIDQGNSKTEGEPPSLERDLKELDKLIFEIILRPPGSFTNSGAGNPPPRLPSGLLDFQNKLRAVGKIRGVETLNNLVNHYSLIDWEMRKNIIKSQHDGGLCLIGKAAYFWYSLIPRQGVMHQFFDETQNPTSNVGPRVRRYREHKEELLRFMRNFFEHVEKKSYCDDNHKSLEYVETVLSETFHQYYISFF